MNLRLPAPERRAQLLDTALAVFASEGYHGTTMDQVAARAGVTKPVVYQHFDSKHDLFHQLLRDVGARLAETVTAAVTAAARPHDQVREGMRAYFAFVDDHPDAFLLLFGDGVRNDPAFAAEVSTTERVFAEVVAGLITIEGLDGRDRLLLAHGVVGLAEATSRHWVAQGRARDRRDLADQVAELAWAGLRGRPPDDRR